MKNFLFVIAFLIILTSIIVGINPKMHKPMNIGGAEFVMQNEGNIKNTELKVENKDSVTDKKTTTVTPHNTIKQVDNIKSKDTNINAKWEQLVKLQEQEDLARQKALALAQQQKAEQAKKLAQQKAQEEAKKKSEAAALAKKQAEEQAKKLAQQKAQEEANKQKTEALAKKQADEQAKKIAQQRAQEEAKNKSEAAALAKKQAEEQAKKLAQQKAQEEAKKKAEEQKKLVEYQENILWNQWRANVCNNVANRLDQQFAYVAPIGTIYSYSFDVDNQRRITNISVRISKGYVNATTQQGITMIYNAIRSMNLSTALTFPSGSQRTTVKVSSGIERTASQSTSINANSFNDVETVTKQKYQGVN